MDKGEIVKALNEDIKGEHGAIIQYLSHAYNMGEGEIACEIEAINEMQHLGWLAEELVDKGATPKLEHTQVDRSTETSDMLKANITVEKEVTVEYTKQSQKVQDPKLRQLLQRIRDHEIYHDEVFGDLLKKFQKK